MLKNWIRTVFFLLIPIYGYCELRPVNNNVTEPALVCSKKESENLLIKGFNLQKDHNTEEALVNYQKCLNLEPDCVSCLYEIGWSYWKQGSWEKVIDTWNKVLLLRPTHAQVLEFLPTAKENLKIIDSKNKIEVFRNKTNLMISSEPKDAPVSIVFVSRWQAYNSKVVSPIDHFDLDIDSPKSASFSPDGKKVYVNSLEGSKTVVFDPFSFVKLAVIQHKFEGSETFIDKKAPFDYEWPKVQNPNEFSGRPVESISSHNGKYLWVPYYRRSYDELGSHPSAIAIIDAESLKIIRVMGTGPIAKYVQVSSDGRYLAISHWGDNTVGLFDIRGNDPFKFKEISKLVVGDVLTKKIMVGNRDKNCGFCVRGLSFSKDSRYLFVSRMSKGGIAVFDLEAQGNKSYLGTLFGIHPGPRDIQIDHSGEFLYSGCNATGFIQKVRVKYVLEQFKNKPIGSSVIVKPEDLNTESVFAGTGVRSIKLTQDGKYLFAAINKISELHVYDTRTMKRIAQIPVDSYPVGLALSPDGGQAWVTSQGNGHKGGNSVGVYQIQYHQEEHISKTKYPQINFNETNVGKNK